jgi:hypothetical protein
MAYKLSKSSKIDPVRPQCKKKIFYTAEDARDMIHHITETRVTREIHPYKCPICGLWHLTSKAGK